MTRTILAHIRAIRAGHSGRSLVHAVDTKQHEYKLEVSTDELRGAVGDMLVLSWTIHANPAVITPVATATPPASSPPVTGAAAVDEQFDTLMRGAAAAPTPDQQLAALLGATAPKPG